ncbi:spore germination protein [Oceanobacillus limi]|uniref:Spore germination protein n=1 Tax=Oceanobacillus limi TaxID=930131 RepID=A0A1I0CD03_9BACI|nr:endospore germination permease [Oceanobacillus limi]SET16985.1 spore germination protein [Oceanobacillus limi]
MTDFKYADEHIGDREIMIAVPSTVVAVSVLTLPRYLAESTIAADAWVSLLFGGGIAIVLVWLATKLAVKFPRQSFLTYTSRLATKPVAYLFSSLYIILGVMLTSFEIRAISEISHQYLFDKTPMEVVSLAFLFVVTYAVAGSRAGLFRLHSLFFPIAYGITLFVIFLSFAFLNVENWMPRFQTDFVGYRKAMQSSALSISGFGMVGMVLFYISLIKSPQKTPKKVSASMLWVLILYVIIFITCISVFGNVTTANLLFPTIELSRAIELPGGFFNRFETLFFVVWTMAIFNTATMTFDIAVLGLQNLFPKVKKIRFVILLVPFIYLINAIPRNFTEVTKLGEFISIYGFTLTATVTVLLLLLAKVRGVKKSEKS